MKMQALGHCDSQASFIHKFLQNITFLTLVKDRIGHDDMSFIFNKMVSTKGHVKTDKTHKELRNVQ